MHYNKYANCQKYGRTTADGRKVFLHDWTVYPTYWKCGYCGSSKTVKPRTTWTPPPSTPPPRKPEEPYVGSAKYYEDVARRAREADEAARRRRERSRNFWEDMFGNRTRGPDAVPRPDSSKPVQIQIMEFFESLAKTQSLGFADGEILTMWHIALKKAGMSK